MANYDVIIIGSGPGSCLRHSLCATGSKACVEGRETRVARA